MNVNNNDVAFGTTFPYLGLPHATPVNGAAMAASAGTPSVAAPSAGEGGTASVAASLPVLPIGLGAAGVLIAALGFGTLVLSRRRA